VAHEAGNLNDFRTILGNDVAIKVCRKGNLPFPDGTIIIRLAWSYVPSEENNKVFGRDQSLVAGPPINVQLMVKDSRKYAATGGWGSVNSKTANLPTRRRTKPASPATNISKLAMLSSTITHLNTENQIINMSRSPWKNLFPRQTLGAFGNLFLCARKPDPEAHNR
jgi:hypothetical protein